MMPTLPSAPACVASHTSALTRSRQPLVQERSSPAIAAACRRAGASPTHPIARAAALALFVLFLLPVSSSSLTFPAGLFSFSAECGGGDRPLDAVATRFALHTLHCAPIHMHKAKMGSEKIDSKLCHKTRTNRALSHLLQRANQQFANPLLQGHPN